MWTARPCGSWVTSGGALTTSLAEDEGDEQPVDVAALVEALVEACTQTGGEHYGRQAVHAFEWFLGRNTHGLPVYDFATGGCHDGLGPAGPSENEGRSPPWPTCRRGLRSRAPDFSGSSVARNEGCAPRADRLAHSRRSTTARGS